ncbi:hypothetical protein HAX54_005673 [Datura stramonium]|uniref:Peptidase A1 domain-containing protein n=1 Tax=Datura stramonium TaxID=4076 RepID=A0ABS8TAS7_DATST|nr:hypothetical protein [Datura stramonium]
MIDNDLEKNVGEYQIYPFYTSEFLVPIKIGTPPVPQILTMDTGNLLLWVHCGFTIGGEGSPAPLYQYVESSSYVEDVYCEIPVCEFLMLKGQCGVSRRCDVADKFLDIDPNIFKRVDHQGGMLVDSGASSTYLPDIAFKKLKEEIKSVNDTTLEEHISSRPNELCYLGIIT